MTKNQEEILRDQRKNGKNYDWRGKKLDNLRYSELLQVLEFKKAGNVRTCADILTFEQTEEGQLKLAQTWFCKSKLCPMCNWRRAMKHSNQVIQILNEAVKRQPKGRFLFWTLTTKNVFDGEKLKAALSQMTQGFNRLVKYKKIEKNLLGYLRATEVTVNEKDGSYNQHMHVLIFVKQAYFSRSENYISQAELTEFWKKAMKLDYVPVVHVQAVKPKGKSDSGLLEAAYETAKYPVKSVDYLTPDQETNLQVVEDLEQGLFRKRLIAYGGLFKKIRKELQLENVEEAELVKVDSEEDDAPTIGNEIVARWNWERKNYVVKRGRGA